MEQYKFIEELKKDSYERNESVSNNLKNNFCYYLEVLGVENYHKINNQIKQNIPVEDMMFSEDTKLIRNFAINEGNIPLKFKNGTLTQLENCRVNINTLKSIAEQVQDPDNRKMMYQIIKLYEDALEFEIARQKQIEMAEQLKKKREEVQPEKKETFIPIGDIVESFRLIKEKNSIDEKEGKNEKEKDKTKTKTPKGSGDGFGIGD